MPFTRPPHAVDAPKKDWRKTLLAANSTLRQAISCLDASALQIALVVTPDNVFLGTLTDGDIRRGLLRGLDRKSVV